MKNYTLGRGELWFSTFLSGTQTPAGFRYIGNSPEFSLTIESENLDHYSADSGIREKDDSVPLDVTRTGAFTCDDIQPENVALFFYGLSSLVTQTAATAQTWSAKVRKGRGYQVGYTAANPSGVRGITVTDVKVGAVSKALNTDYTIDGETGFLYIVPESTIADDADIVVTYNTLARQIERVQSGSQPTEGALKYRAKNPKGKNIDYDLPYVKITPNGDLQLKGDEWQVIPFSIEALKPGVGEAILANGRPFAV